MKYIALIIFSALLDIFCKDRIERDYERIKQRHERSRWSRYVRLHRVHNAGFSFGKLQKYQNLVKFLPSAVSAYVAFLFLRLLVKGGEAVKLLSLALVLGGALSNIRDRFHYHYVIDYISLNFAKIKNIVFNLGDIYIMIGSILYALGGIFFGRQ